MKALPYSPEAYTLLHEGAIALAQVEFNGIRIDMEYLIKAIRRTKRKIAHLEKALQNTKVMKVWKKSFKRPNINSTDQLGQVLFDKMGFECPARTAPSKMFPEGKPKVDEKSLSMVDHPFVQDFLAVKKLKKSLSTYLLGIRREVVKGYLHPFYNLHKVHTFRSSSDNPNFQNIPIRNPEISKLIRRIAISHLGVIRNRGGITVAVQHEDKGVAPVILIICRIGEQSRVNDVVRILPGQSFGFIRSHPGNSSIKIGYFSRGRLFEFSYIDVRRFLGILTHEHRLPAIRTHTDIV